MKRSRNTLILLVFLLLILSGCVYYNTFFLAKKNYRLAERLRRKAGGDVVPPQARAYYDKAIEKSAKVLAYYPESEYVDDALYLLGMCYLRTGEYSKALRKFNELLENFPESEFADDSRYWRSVCLYYGGKEEAAVDSLELFAKEDPKRAEDALFMIGELAYKDSNFIDAQNAFKRFLERFPKSSLAPKARLRLGQISWYFEKYDECVKYLEKIGAGDLPKREFVDSQKLLAQCYIKLGKYNKAEKILTKITGDEIYRDYWAEAELIIGDVAMARGEFSRAEKIWFDIIKAHPHTESAAWAYYRLGEMYYKLGDLKKAKEMFDFAAKEYTRSEVSSLAARKSAVIARILEHRYAIKNADSLGTNVVKAQLELAEMYITELNQPDTALNIYSRILSEHPEDSLAPHAAYSMGWVYANLKGDLHAADSVFALVLERYPESDFAVGAARYFKRRGGSLDSLSVRNVAYYFIKAEEFWLTYEWPDSAIKYYSIVIDSFPGSRYVPKAMAAKAEILAANGKTEEAKKIYEELSKLYPNTPYDSLAKVRLGEKVALASRGVTTRPSSLASGTYTPITKTSEEDTSSLIEGLPPAPRPIRPIRLYYPEQEWSSRLRGKRIYLKIKIDPFGKVSDVKLIRGCGNDVIDNAAILAAKKAEFNPSDIEITMFNKWFLLTIYVQRPTPEYQQQYQNY